MKNDVITLLCEICAIPTGLSMKLGHLREEMEVPKDVKQMKHGLCTGCQETINQQGVIFIDIRGRAMAVTPQAAKEKISPEFLGKIIRIPASAMEELIKAYEQVHPPLTN